MSIKVADAMALITRGVDEILLSEELEKKLQKTLKGKSLL